MKIEYYDGCTGSSISIDGEYLGHEPDKQKMLEVASLILNSKEPNILEQILKDLIQGNSREQEDLGTCGQCGDYSRIYKLEII